MRSKLPLALLMTAACAACGSLGDSARADSPALSCQAATAAPVVAWRPHLEVIDDGLRSLPTFAQGARSFVLGSTGERYRLKIVNPTGDRIEAVVSVDGLDAIDGKPASTGKRGYLVPAHGEVTVDGWRTSLDTVAAFRFSSVRDSYAARTQHERNVGVIGFASFRERVIEPEVSKASPSRDDYEAPRSRSSGAPAPAPAAPPSAAERRASSSEGAGAARPGLGTEFGEAHQSSVSEVPFERRSSSPDVVAEIRYDDRAGLEARGIRTRPCNHREEEIERRDHATAFPEARFAQPPP